MEKSPESLSKRTSVADKLVDFLQTKCSEVESRKRNLESAWESVSERMWEVERLRESLDKRAWELEERERDFFAFEERRKREMVCEEDELNLRRLRFLSEVRMNEEELDQRLAAVNERAEWLEMAEAEVREMRRVASERLKNIEAERESLREEKESLVEREKKVDVIIRALDSRISAVEKKEEEFNSFLEGRKRELALKEENINKKWADFAQCRDYAGRESFALKVKENRESVGKKSEELEKMKIEFNSFREEKNRELASKENLLEMMRQELVKDVELRNEQLIEREELGRRLLKRLELAKDNVEGLRRSVDERFKEVGFKMRELASKEQLLDVGSREVFRDAELRNKELLEREKLGRQLLERLKLAKDIVEGLKTTVHERFVEINMKETELDSLRDWVEMKMDEADMKAKEVEEQEERIAEKEAHPIAKETELQEKEKDLLAWQKKLEDKQKQIELARKSIEQKVKKLDSREKNLNSVREFIRNCFKEHLDIKRKLKAEKHLVEKRARYLVPKEKELELREKQMRDTAKLLELKQQHSTNIFNAPIEIKPHDSADLKFVVRMDGKILQMFVNDAEKDMESMGDEVFKVLHLSSDPAKLVLDAMMGFYPPHLRKEDEEGNVRRTCITLLDQLIKMSPNIKPNVREEAVEVATSWKSKMSRNAENARPLEVLGFLFLVSAFGLASYFNEDEISSFVMMVDQHREACELHGVLGSAMSTQGSV